ncbi:MAG: 50S ribosomal protein L18 [Bdellovibrionota bacterium]
MSEQRQKQKLIRQSRVRKKVVSNASRPRLCVFRSNKHVYAQIIDDQQHKTLVSASTLLTEVKTKVKNTVSMEAASAVGALVAERAKAQNILEVCFDRGAYLYHGRVKALADAARENGLQF